jgi:hypothetical protein
MQDFELPDRYSFAIKKEILAPNGAKGDSDMAAKKSIKSAMTTSLLFVVLAFSITAHAKIFYVNEDAIGNNNGSSWSDAFNYLQDALSFASSGDEIRVAQGVYKPYGGMYGDDEFRLITGVAIKGGYAGWGKPGVDVRDIKRFKTILSGDLNGDDVEVTDPVDLWNEPTRVDNVPVFWNGACDETAVLDGFIITAGRSTYGGGGMINHYSHPTIINCIFSANTAGYDGYEGGGAIYNYHSNPVLINCRFIGNSAGDSCGGGGIYNEYSNPTLINCTFIGNTAEYYGGGMINFWSNPILTDCTFTDNFSPYRGGGIHNDSGSFRPILTNCTFTGNSADDGGGIYGSSTNSPILTNCTFRGNLAGECGGAVCNGASGDGGGSPTINNCLFIGNRAGKNGGAVHNGPHSNTILKRCTFSDNSASNGNALACNSSDQKHPSDLEITSCIFWDGGNEIWNNDNSTISINYSDVHGGWLGEGNIDADPCFVDAVKGDCRLLLDSPCIDTGDPNFIAEPNEKDLDCKPRVMDGNNDSIAIVDMGAYEFKESWYWYVDDDAPNDTGPGNPDVSDPVEDGTSAHPFDAIQEAIDVTRSGDTVIVLDGTYTGTGNRDIDFNGKPITLRSENGPDNCIIDCQDSGRGFYLNNGEDQNSILDGFTIKNGNVSGRDRLDDCGGGIYCGGQSSPAIRNNRIIANKATIGGGVYCSGETVVRNNLITHNTATFSGGGVYCSRHAVIEQNTITDNVTAGEGGGVECYEWNTVANNVISRNSADRGGGIWTWEDYPSTIVGNLISENWAEQAGGGIGVSWDYYTVIAGNLIVYNATGGSGGAIYLASDSSLIINNTIVGNTATSGGGIVNLYWEATVTNCIVWGNGDDLFGCTVTYSCIEDDDHGEGNIHSNPLFVDPLNSDYHLLPSSPCIDAGDPNYIAEPNETDLDGKPRILDGNNDASAVVDMGAYEYRFTISAEARIVPQTINLASKGNWITSYIWLPEEYDVTDIDPNSVLLEDEIKPEQFSVDEQAQVATARFSREDVQAILEIGDINLKITGRLNDGTVFDGTDTIKVLNKAGKN